MSSYPTPPPPPPPPPFGYGADPMSPPPLPPPPPPPFSSTSSSTAFPGPGLLTLPQQQQPPIQQQVTAPDPYTIALPGISSTQNRSFPAAAPPPPAPSPSSTLVLPLGPPPSNVKRGAKGNSGAGRARQTKSTSADPGQVDDDLLPPPTPGAEGGSAAPAATAAGGGGRANEEEEAEEAEADEDEDEDEVESMELRRQNMRENLPYLIEVMTPEQIDRHDAFRRHGLNRANIKKIINQVTSQSVADNVAVLAAGAAKIFVGEIVERARAVQVAELERTAGGSPGSARNRGGAGRSAGRDAADPGPIRPDHIQEAYRLYMLERDRPGRYPPTGGASGIGKRRRLF